MEVYLRIYTLNGWLNKFSQTGGTITARETQYLVAEMNSIAEQSRAEDVHRRWLADELDAAAAGPVHPHMAIAERAAGASLFAVIEGGRA